MHLHFAVKFFFRSTYHVGMCTILMASLVIIDMSSSNKRMYYLRFSTSYFAIRPMPASPFKEEERNLWARESPFSSENSWVFSSSVLASIVITSGMPPVKSTPASSALPETMSWKTWFCSIVLINHLVWPIQLGICLFQEGSPKFIFLVRVKEDQSSISCRKQVVNHNLHPLIEPVKKCTNLKLLRFDAQIWPCTPKAVTEWVKTVLDNVLIWILNSLFWLYVLCTHFFCPHLLVNAWCFLSLVL